jgi:outer membrane immunogenic protein
MKRDNEMRWEKLAIIAAATAATAASFGIAVAPAAAQGFRVEAHGGWDRLSGENVTDDGILYGIGVGYDLPVGGRFVLGIEGNADFSSIKECEQGAIAAGDELCVRATRDLSAVARVGYNIAPQSQIYLLAGYTNARFRADYTAANSDTVREWDNLSGLRLGAGFQQDFGNGIYSKIEYRYSNYEQGLERHQVVGGVGLRF